MSEKKTITVAEVNMLLSHGNGSEVSKEELGVFVEELAVFVRDKKMDCQIVASIDHITLPECPGCENCEPGPLDKKKNQNNPGLH